MHADQVNNSCRLCSLWRTWYPLRAYRQRGVRNDSVLYKMTTSSVIYIYIHPDQTTSLAPVSVRSKSVHEGFLFNPVLSIFVYSCCGQLELVQINVYLPYREGLTNDSLILDIQARELLSVVNVTKRRVERCT